MTRPASVGAFISASLVVSFLLAFFVGPQASSSPDGLEKVTADLGLATDGRVHSMSGGPLADYAVDGIGSAGMSTAVAGVIGVAITFGAAVGVSKLTKTSRSRNRVDDAA